MTESPSASALAEKENPHTVVGMIAVVTSCRQERAKARVSKSHACMIICQVLRVRVLLLEPIRP